MFHAMLVKLKQAGKGSVTHKDPISKEDFLKIKSSSVLDVDTPAGLQNKVFIDIMLHMCLQSRTGKLRNFSKSDFAIDVDSSNDRYSVYFAFDKPTENHRGESHDDSRSQSGRMYETHRIDCPVQ